MNDRLEELMYDAGLTAQGCWDELDDYAKEAIERFAELIVRDCGRALQDMPRYYKTADDRQIERDTIADCIRTIQERFGVK